MYKIKVSQRYEDLYKLEVLKADQYQAPHLLENFTQFPILFRTDAAARSTGNLIIADLAMSKAPNYALLVDKQPVLSGCKETLLEIVKIWNKQHLFLDFEIKIAPNNSEDFLPLDENLMVKVYNLSS